MLFADQFEEVLAADDCPEFLAGVLPEPDSDDGQLRLVCTLQGRPPAEAARAPGHGTHLQDRPAAHLRPATG
jgi:hypothetical protein